jgi:hypothetical protein
MAALKEKGLALLATNAAVNMVAGSAVATLYTVPTGKTAIISHVVVRGPSATLAGGSDFDFTQWRQTVDLSAMTATTDYRVINGNDTKYQLLAAATAFQITKSTGSTGAATATIDVFGYLF